jgi:hypothetical protein
MIAQDDWKTSFEAEIQQAEKARDMGNEGMARVCARRAAGALAGEYIKRRAAQTGADQPGLDRYPTGAYDRLRFLCQMPGISPRVAQTADHFLSRVTTEHTLPIEADLITEARWLRQELLGE